MLRLNKKTEYALLALRYLGRTDPDAEPSALAPGIHASAREIATWYNIPEGLLAKVLQGLKRLGVLTATKGGRGGYRLGRPLSQVPLLQILTAFSGEPGLVECISDNHDTCAQARQCDIKGPLEVLNRAVMQPLQRMSVQDLFIGETRQDTPRMFSIMS
ncbi:MAG: Rrf2 family protein [Myxococcota bacterium]